jgi:RNA polymerase sigma factor (sigma-70 family)
LVAVPSIGRATEVTPRRGAPEADATRDLYERYARQIHAYCLHQLGSREEAEDAVQSTFLNAFRGLKRGIDPEFESAWLYKIAENVCLTRQRSSYRRRRIESPGDLDAMQDLLPSPEADNDRLIRLPEALEEMPEQQRRALLLREWQGLSYREIADELGLSQSAIETLLFRARRSLANALTDEPRPKKTGVQKLRTGGDAGSLIALVKTVAFSGGAKVAVTVATVAATSVVATTPAVRHSAEQVFAPAHGPQARALTTVRRVHQSLLFHSGPAVALAATRVHPRSGKLIAAASRAAYNAGLLRGRGSTASMRSGAVPAATGGRATLVLLPASGAPTPPSPRGAADDPPVTTPLDPAPSVVEPAATDPAPPSPEAGSGSGSLPPASAPAKDTGKGPQSETPAAPGSPLPLQVDAKAARQAEKDAKKAAKGTTGHGNNGDAPIVIPPTPLPTTLPPVAAVSAPPLADAQPVSLSAPVDAPAVGTTPAPPVTADPGNSDHGDNGDHSMRNGRRK